MNSALVQILIGKLGVGTTRNKRSDILVTLPLLLLLTFPTPERYQNQECIFPLSTTTDLYTLTYMLAIEEINNVITISYIFDNFLIFGGIGDQ